VIDVLEQLDLDRVAGAIDRLDAVDHDAAHAAHETAVEERDRAAEPPSQLGLPVVPGLEVHVGPGHAPAALVEHVQIIAPEGLRLEELLATKCCSGSTARNSQPNMRCA